MPIFCNGSSEESGDKGLLLFDQGLSGFLDSTDFKMFDLFASLNLTMPVFCIGNLLNSRQRKPSM